MSGAQCAYSLSQSLSQSLPQNLPQSFPQTLFRNDITWFGRRFRPLISDKTCKQNIYTNINLLDREVICTTNPKLLVSTGAKRIPKGSPKLSKWKQQCPKWNRNEAKGIKSVSKGNQRIKTKAMLRKGRHPDVNNHWGDSAWIAFFLV